MQETQEILGWLGALFGGGALVTVGKFWFDAGAKARKLDDTEKRVDDIDKRVAALAAELAAHKIESERAFAMKADLAALERRFAEAVEGMRSDFRGMSQRLDRLLETLAGKH